MKGVVQAELLSARKRPGVWVVGGAWTGLALAFGMIVPYIVWLAIRNRPPGSAGDPEKLIDGLLPDRFLAGTVDLYPMFGSALELVPDADSVTVLATRNQAIWDRVEKASFLTDDEKRAAVGYGKRDA